MAKVEDYRIISYNDHHRLNAEVKHLITDGWQPWGEMSVVTSRAALSPVFSQTMVKYNTLWDDII